MFIDKKRGQWLFALCWIAYFSSYLGRYSYSGSMANLIQQGVLTETTGGLISTLYFLGYAFGQICNGYLADKKSPLGMVFSGLLGSAICNFFMAFTPDYRFMGLYWAINGFLQSMIWPSIMFIFTRMYSEELSVSCITNVASAMALGTATSYGLTTFALHRDIWQLSYLIPAVWLLVIAVGWLVYYRKFTSGFQFEHYIEEATDRQYVRGTSFRFILSSSLLLTILLPTVVYGALKDGISVWIPTMLSQTFQTPAQIATLFTILLPFVNITGAYAAQYVYRKLHHNELKSLALFFFISLCSLILLYYFSDMSMLLSTLLLSIITSSMMANNNILIGFIPLHFVKAEKSSFVSGFLNSISYFGAAIGSFMIGILAMRFGWQLTILCWCGMTLFAFLICFLKRNMVDHKEAS